MKILHFSLESYHSRASFLAFKVSIKILQCDQGVGLSPLWTSLHALRHSPVGLKRALELAQYVRIRDNDAQFAVLIERLRGNVFGTHKGSDYIHDDDLGVHI